LSILNIVADVNRGRIVKEGGVSKLNKVLNALLSGKYKHPEGVARACGAFRNLAFKNGINTSNWSISLQLLVGNLTLQFGCGTDHL
jgi:hypothetical protein